MTRGRFEIAVDDEFAAVLFLVAGPADLSTTWTAIPRLRRSPRHLAFVRA
jgi:hypothetical protein